MLKIKNNCPNPDSVVWHYCCNSKMKLNFSFYFANISPMIYFKGLQCHLILKNFQGCTATVLLVWADGHENFFAQCANVGDSACVVTYVLIFIILMLIGVL